MTKKNERRKEISDFAVKLRELIASAPDGYARRDLNQMIVGLRRRYSLSPEQKQLMILDLLASGLTTYSELHAETKFGRTQLTRSLNQLQSDKKIRVERSANSRSGAGRPTSHYFCA